MDHAAAVSQLALLLAMAFAGGALLRTLKQPALVGYILVGLIVGPSVLGIVHGEQQISMLADFGILLLLFIIGLELDLKSFEKVYKIALITVLIQIGVTFVTVEAVGYFLHWPFERMMILTFAIALSSTAVAIKMLEDMDAIKTPAGQTAIGVLVAQDLAIIPMMLIIGTFKNDSFQPFDLVKIFGAVAFMGAVIFYLSRRGFDIKLPQWLKRFMKGGESSQIVIKALAFCFSAAALSGAMGLSASYGAFLAGLLIGSTQNKDVYEHHIRPVFDILMMFFFLSVGLLIDLKFMMAHSVSIIFMLVFIMVMKTAVNTGVLHYLGLPRRNALIKGAVLGQIGEFSFVLAGMGLSIGALAMDDYKYIVTLIALSLIVTPVWIRLIQKTITWKRWLQSRSNRPPAAG